MSPKQEVGLPNVLKLWHRKCNALFGDTGAQVCTSLHSFTRDARDTFVLHPLLLKTVRMYMAHGITLPNEGHVRLRCSV
jgi:hypothetical protein